MAIGVLITYDLEEDSDYSLLKQELIKKGYVFKLNSKSLPNTTCVATFQEGPSLSAVISTVKKEFKAAEQKVSQSTFCQITRLAIVAFEEEAGKIDNTW